MGWAWLRLPSLSPIKLSAPYASGQKITKFAEHHWFLGFWFLRLDVCAVQRAFSSCSVPVLRTVTRFLPFGRARNGSFPPTPHHHTVAMMTSKWAMSLTLCSRSGAMRARFSLENSQEGKMWIT